VNKDDENPFDGKLDHKYTGFMKVDEIKKSVMDVLILL
jgi:hypothetical protein